MKDKVFFDTNVIVYLFDKSEDSKHKIAKDLLASCLRSCETWISIQVVNEFIVIASQKISAPLQIKELSKRIDFLSAHLEISQLRLSACRTALEIKERYKLSYWDSLIATSALENGCTTLYSEDMQDGFVINGALTVKNPF
jgi:predicted nucleic acid-binding protein